MKFFKKQQPVIDEPIPDAVKSAPDAQWEIHIVPAEDGHVQSHYRGIDLPNVINMLKLIVYDYERLVETKKEE